MNVYQTSDIEIPVGRCRTVKINTNGFCPKDFGIDDKDPSTCEVHSGVKCLTCWNEALKDIKSAELIFHKKEEKDENHEKVAVLSNLIVAGFQVRSSDKESPELETISGNSVSDVLHQVGERFGPEIEKHVSDKLLGQNEKVEPIHRNPEDAYREDGREE